MDVTVQPNCLGISMPDGTEYKANSKGHVTIDDPRHEKMVRNSDTLARGYTETRKVFADQSVPGKVCTECHFHAFAFSTKCPRCGCETFDGD